jgi:hypothetical protein
VYLYSYVLYVSQNKQRTCVPTQSPVISFYNRGCKCLLRGTNWVFKYSSLRFVFKGLIYYGGVHNKSCASRWLIVVDSARHCFVFRKAWSQPLFFCAHSQHVYSHVQNSMNSTHIFVAPISARCCWPSCLMQATIHPSFLGQFGGKKRKKATVSFAMCVSLSISPSVRPPERNNSAHAGRNFTKFYIWVIFRKYNEKNSRVLKIWQEYWILYMKTNVNLWPFLAHSS